jgi:hypothetical protein
MGSTRPWPRGSADKYTSIYTSTHIYSWV